MADEVECAEYEQKFGCSDKVVCVDPYAKAVATFTDYMNPRKSIVVGEDNFDWEDTNWIQRDWKDLIIYEICNF